MGKSIKKRGRPALKPDIERIIATEVRDEQKKPLEKRAGVKVLAYKIQRKMIERAPGQKPPELSTIEKRISTYRRVPEDSLDELWSLASLVKHPIPPEAMPVVMAFYKKRLAENDVLTIREALWAARLYRIIEPLDLVFDWAFLYAIDELVAEESGKPFKSKELDRELIETPQHAREVMREIKIWGIAFEYKADPMQLKELDLSLEETEEAAKTGKYKWDKWDKQEAENEG